MELRNYLQSQPREPASLKCYVEAPFTIDEPRHVVTAPVVWPFLLMICTH